MTAPLRRTILASLGALLLAAGCAASTAAPASAPSAAAPERGGRATITRDEIAAIGATDLYQVVQRLRPQWLRGGTTTSIRGSGGTAVVVYQNNTPLGGPDALRQMAPGYATAVRFLDGPEASNTLPGLGSRSVAGAIVVVTPAGR